MSGEQELNGLRKEIETTRAEIEELRSNLIAKEKHLNQLEMKLNAKGQASTTAMTTTLLSNEEIARYSRQLILPGFGVRSQKRLKAHSVLIVGAGGLGCPAAQYLAAAGIGKIGIVDYDDVDRTNLHRQILHTSMRIGLPKVESARKVIEEMNPSTEIVTFNEMANSENIVNIISSEKFDIVLDCTDNVATRYLLNDACVMLEKPLVSGSALQLDGQITVYNYGECCPCYRCLFPVPPPPESVTKCGDGGVLGAVTGVIGTLQALEAIKIATQMGDVLAGRLLIFDGGRCLFRNIKLRGRRRECEVCSPNRLTIILDDYEQFCGMRASDKDYALALLHYDERMTVLEYHELRTQCIPHLLIDVRSEEEFEICHLPNSVNLPLKHVLNDSYLERFKDELTDENRSIVVLCRRGNDSQIAVQHMRNRFPKHDIHDIIGGLHAWHFDVDKHFPIY